MGLDVFFTDRPGTHQGRIENPDGYEPAEGDAALVLGADSPGFDRRFNPGDRLIYQQSADPEGADFLQLQARLRAPVRAPLYMIEAEPYALSDGDTLKLQVTDEAEQTVTFETADFNDIANASAAEVAAAINADVTGMTAHNTGDNHVQVDPVVEEAVVDVTGGTAVNALDPQTVAWRFIVEVEDDEVVSRVLAPGRTRDLFDLAGQIPAGTPTVRIIFEVGVLASQVLGTSAGEVLVTSDGQAILVL